MKFLASVNIMPHAELLDPQGKVVTSALHNLGLSTVANTRVGKHITFEVEAENIERAHEVVRTACDKLLANPVMESYNFELSQPE